MARVSTRAHRRPDAATLSGLVLGFEEQGEDDHHAYGEGARQPPERLPLGEAEAGFVLEEVVEHRPGCLRADQHTGAISYEHEQTLSLAADFVAGALVHVDLTGDEKEVVADAVQRDATEDHPGHLVRCTEGKQSVAQGPSGHADNEHPFHSEPPEQEWHDEHETNFGHLPDRLGAGDVGEAGGAEVELGEVIVGGEGDTDQERAGEKDKEGGARQYPQGIDAEDSGEGDFFAATGRRGMG